MPRSSRDALRRGLLLRDAVDSAAAREDLAGVDRHDLAAVRLGERVTSASIRHLVIEPARDDAAVDDQVVDVAVVDEALLVAQLRGELADLFAASGAASFQIGKLYRYRASLDAGTLAMLDALKRQLDPRGLMNPGVLGFAAPTV